jgi:hypothetical protein
LKSIRWVDGSLIGGSNADDSTNVAFAVAAGTAGGGALTFKSADGRTTIGPAWGDLTAGTAVFDTPTSRAIPSGALPVDRAADLPVLSKLTACGD